VLKNLQKITQAIAGRIDADSLYLCGPFDHKGEPASTDIHILALSSGGEVKDLHLLPELAGLEKRVEVSVVPLTLVKSSLCKGVGTWLAFYTLDKIAKGKPLGKSREAADLKHSLEGGMRLRPSFYAGRMRNLRDAWFEANRTARLPESGLKTNLVLLLTLCLYSLLSLRRPFSRNSDLLTQTREKWRLGGLDRKDAEEILRSGKRFVETVLRQSGVRPEALQESHLCFPQREEHR
jgi:hypothetical protein